MSTSAVLAAVTHHILMFSHHGSAEQDSCGNCSWLVGWKMKRDFLFIECDILLIYFHGFGSEPCLNKEGLTRRGFALVIHPEYSSQHQLNLIDINTYLSTN